ncbi:MAG TPA: site-specific integrase [Candidatus Sulfotelmatobacter sp.]|jgi:site-specific recombinase XerD|nr:site-specific integrase [Candidatus Sulfotelmatobacter sp.]
MTATIHVAPLLQSFFTKRLMQEKQVSHHTISSYRDTFRLLLKFLAKKIQEAPSRLCLDEISASVVTGFLSELERERGISVRSRNLRLTAIRSFFTYLALEVPTNTGQIQQVLAIPQKRHVRTLVNFLNRDEAEALLRAPNLNTWAGRRDHALMLLALQTGLRLSELIALRKNDVKLQGGAHVRVIGKGRKERCTPLAKRTVAVLRAWSKESWRDKGEILFVNARGGQLSADGVQYIVAKHASAASHACESLTKKHVTPHVLRHTAAMELLQAGVDRTVIALWLGHESIETTQVYLDADLSMKEKALAKVQPMGEKLRRYKPDDELVAFLKAL